MFQWQRIWQSLAITLVGLFCWLGILPIPSPQPLAMGSVWAQDNPSTYPSPVKQTFIQSCTARCNQGAQTNPRAASMLQRVCAPTCTCSFTNLSQQLSYQEFLTWESYLKAKKTVPSAIQSRVDQAMQACTPDKYL